MEKWLMYSWILGSGFSDMEGEAATEKGCGYPTNWPLFSAYTVPDICLYGHLRRQPAGSSVFPVLTRYFMLRRNGSRTLAVIRRSQGGFFSPRIQQ